MGPPEKRIRPAGDGTNGAMMTGAGNLKSGSSVRARVELLADLDALAEHLRGRLVVQVVVAEEKYRTYIYRSTAAAERCVQRAAERGKRSHVTLVRMLPIGVVGLDR